MKDNITEEDIEKVVDIMADEAESSTANAEASRLGISLSALMLRVTQELVARGS